MASAESLRVEVVYCPNADRAERIELDLPSGATVLQALRASGLLERYPEIDWAHQHCGVWGHIRSPEHELCNGDRVEVYRPLVVDPKEARRLRYRRQREARRR